MISIQQVKIVDNLKFNNWIDSIKHDNHQGINNIIIDCSAYFLTHRRLMEEKYILPSSKIKEKQIMLQQQIALEAIDYLCVKSSYSLLEYLLKYSIYKLYKNEQDNLFKQKNTENNIYSICLLAIKIIMLTPWVEEFQSIQNNYKRYNQKENEHKKINIKSGYIDGWSNTFTVQLAKGDYLASQLGYGIITLEALHTNNTLSLFHKKTKY